MPIAEATTGVGAFDLLLSYVGIKQHLEIALHQRKFSTKSDLAIDFNGLLYQRIKTTANFN